MVYGIQWDQIARLFHQQLAVTTKKFCLIRSWNYDNNQIYLPPKNGQRLIKFSHIWSHLVEWSWMRQEYSFDVPEQRERVRGLQLARCLLHNHNNNNGDNDDRNFPKTSG